MFSADVTSLVLRCRCVSVTSMAPAPPPRQASLAAKAAPVDARPHAASQGAPAASQGAVARAASQGALHQEEDPLYREYSTRRFQILGEGADGGVIRGIQRASGHWHALKFMSRQAYNPKKEIDLLRRCDHANVLPLLATFPPHPPTRAWWVLVTPEADANLLEFIRRRAAWGGLAQALTQDLAGQLLSALAHLREKRIVHRDVKPTNIMVAGDAHGSTRLMLADFSRAQELKRHRASQKGSDPVEASFTTNICTPNFCAPELALGSSEARATYGFAIDMWAFGATAFEMVTNTLFCPGRSLAECLGAARARLGPWPPGAGWGDCPLAQEEVASLEDVVADQTWSLPALHLALRWLPEDRGDPESVRTLLSGGEAPPMRAGPCRIAGAPEVGAAAGETALAASSSPHHEAKSSAQQAIAAIDFDAGLEGRPMHVSAEFCACSGHCYTPKHRYRQQSGLRPCNSVQLLVDSRHCEDCACTIPGCGKPRLRGPLCYRHKAALQSLSAPLKLTFAAKACAREMLPCDMKMFLKTFPEVQKDFTSVLLIAWLREPSAIRAWLATGLPGRCDDAQPEEVVQSLEAVVQELAAHPPLSEWRELGGSGAPQ